MRIRRVGIAQTALRVIVAAMVVALHFALPVVTQVKATSYPTCTIQGTAAAETLSGTSGNDVICTGGGNDTVNAGAGNDIVIAEGGIVTVDLGPGNDAFDGSEAIDATVDGDDGNDTIIGTPGDDDLGGGAGDDSLIGGEGDDSLNGDNGIDQLNGESGNDILRGGNGIDNLNGGIGTNNCDLTGGEALTKTCTYDTKCSTETSINFSTAGPTAMSRDGQHIAIVCGPLIVFSHDYGANWNTSTWSSDPDVFVRGITISDDGQKLNLAQPLLVNGQLGGPITASRDGGVSWSVTSGAGFRTWWGIEADAEGRVIVATHISDNPSLMTPDGSIHISHDFGLTWSKANIPATQFWGSQISADGMVIVVASWSNGIWKSNDSGLTWVKLAWNRYLVGLSMDDTGTKIAVTDATYCILNISTDGGNSFVIATGNIPGTTNPGSLGACEPARFTGDGSALVVNIPIWQEGNAGVYYSKNLGASWTKFYQFQNGFGAVSTTADGTKTVVVDGAPPTAIVTIFVGIPNGAIPGRPTNLRAVNVAGTSLTLSWGLPTGNGGSAITSYRVEVSSNGGKTWTLIPRKASNSLSFKVSGLARGTNYRFRVSTLTNAGVSAATTPLSVTTVGNAPASPTSLKVTSTTATTVTLSWSQATVVGGSAVRNYIVEYSTNSGRTWTVVTKSASTSKSLTVGGFRTKNTYRFRVKSVNDVGVSGYSNAVTVTTR